DLIVVGGGVSKESDQFLPLLNLKTPIVPAQLRNQAGIIGAAWLAVDALTNPDALRYGSARKDKSDKDKKDKKKG
ncbi:MAG: ROK family protein, partial [Dermatophilus congolensis]|nr:ROK family protein [Dermatophilus congolensis]